MLPSGSALSFAKTASDSFDDDPCSCHERTRQEIGGRGSDAGTVGSLKLSAPPPRNGGCRRRTEWRRKDRGGSRGSVAAVRPGDARSGRLPDVAMMQASDLTAYFAYHHRVRTHLSLDKDAPDVRPVERPEAGRVVALPEVMRRRCGSLSTRTWSRHSRRTEPMSRSTNGFCHGLEARSGLPRCPCPSHVPELVAIDRVAIAEKVARGRVGKASTICLAVQWAGGVGHVEVDDAPAMVSEHEEHEEHPQPRGGDREEIEGDQVPEWWRGTCARSATGVRAASASAGKRFARPPRCRAS